MLANNTGMISNVDISGYDIRYNRLTKKGLELINNARVLVGPPDSFVNRSVWEKVIVKDFPYVLEGKKTPEELWDEAIKQGIMTH
jgi:raffinose/stachyose/melibiose transport system substrate-binding protein